MWWKQSRADEIGPGVTIAKRYEVKQCIGRGAAGAIYLARDREFATRLVALKFLSHSGDETARRRFLNEIEALYSLNHPAVVRLYDHFRHGRLLGYAMEYVQGDNLTVSLSRSPLSISRAKEFLIQLCAGTGAIHTAGVIHRDLKPENCLVTGDGQIKISDFGAARFLDGRALTESGSLIGTVDFLSPEYLLHGHLDFRSDVYALGVLGYLMISGKMPWEGHSIMEALKERVEKDAVPVHEINKECPLALSAIIQQAMSRTPELRYQTVKDMLNDLSRDNNPDKESRLDGKRLSIEHFLSEV